MKARTRYIERMSIFSWVYKRRAFHGLGKAIKVFHRRDERESSTLIKQ